MADFNKFFSTIYRWIAIKFLIGIFVIAACYAFLVGFYAISSSWGAPLLLSPSQERVLSFQPQVASLESGLSKHLIDQAAAVATVSALTIHVGQVNALIGRIEGATLIEANEMSQTGKSIGVVLGDKRFDIKQTELSMAEARRLLKQVDDELAAKLITQDQAATRRVGLQSALNAATDARAQAIQLDLQSRQAESAAKTLRGGATSMTALQAVRQGVELRAMSAQLSIQLATATATVDALRKNISELERVIATAKTSPYYRALREEVSVVFLPYSNMDDAKIGNPIYDCYLQVIACRRVGEVVAVYQAEEYAKHPLFKTDLKGRLVEVKFTAPDAFESQVIFVGGKPLFL